MSKHIYAGFEQIKFRFRGSRKSKYIERWSRKSKISELGRINKSKHTKIWSTKTKHNEISQDGRNIPIFGREGRNTNRRASRTGQFRVVPIQKIYKTVKYFHDRIRKITSKFAKNNLNLATY